jgi:hypothetical protein
MKENDLPATPKGRKNPVATERVSSGKREQQSWPLTHEAPESESKELGQRVEGQVAARALGVVVRAGELRAGRREATTGDHLVGHGGHAHGSSGEHLASKCQLTCFGSRREYNKQRTMEAGCVWWYTIVRCCCCCCSAPSIIICNRPAKVRTNQRSFPILESLFANKLDFFRASQSQSIRPFPSP